MSPSPRDPGLDAARAFAILGMFVIHAALVLGTMPHGGLLAGLMWLCDGRAAATFLTLAGIGATRLAGRLPEGDRRRAFGRRAIFLGALGVANLVVWEGDILRVYGVAMALTPWIVARPVRTRAALAVAVAALFPVLAWGFDWEARWNFETLTYRGLWEPAGFVRNLTFDGFRPVIPWLGFYLFGSALAGLDFSSPRLPSRLFAVGIAVAAGSVGLSHALGAGTSVERDALFGTGSMPPMPLFLASAVGTTLVVLALGLWVARLAPRFAAPLVATGRRSLGFYIGHIIVLVGLHLAGFGQSLSPGGAMTAGAALFAAAVAFAWWRREKPGGLETLLRRFSQPRRKEA